MKVSICLQANFKLINLIVDSAIQSSYTDRLGIDMVLRY